MTIEARFHIDRGEFSLNADLAIAGKGVTAVFGPSGCGKTTLLRAIAGLEYNEDGYLRVGDQIWQGDGQFLPPHKRSIGYVFQEPSLFAHLNVQRNIEYGLKRIKGAAHKASIDPTIQLLGIGHLLNRRPSQLSGGEQQRVAIARALASSPDMLLLDEPLAALDDRLKQEILPYLESMHRELEIPVLYVSHSRDEVVRLADHLVLLDNGRVQATGPVGEVFSRLDLAITHDADAESVIETTVAGYDEAFGLLRLDFAGGHFSVAASPLPAGRTVRLQVLARDVSLTLAHQQATSILNIFPATVDQLVQESDAQMTVRLMAGPVPLLSRITRKSTEDLGLKTGDQVYAQVKSASLLIP
jgi:molybdate transport system ATP-binding protein